MPQLAKFIPPPGTRPLPDGPLWCNRFEVKSESSDRIYVIAQNKSTELWGCSCPGYRTRRSCKHLQHLRLPMPAKLLGSAQDRMSAAPKRTTPFMEGYKTDSTRAQGSPQEWSAAFADRMGLKEATSTVGSNSPYAILGILASASWAEIKSAYRKLVMETHPDRGGNAAAFRRVQAAYEVLEDRVGSR
jgi:hypothetical protein